MRPIPRKLLPHSATLNTLSGMDAWQNPAYTEQKLHHVRIEPSSKIVVGKDNTELQLTGILIYDCRNSLPADVLFEPEQIVVWRGRNYRVVTVEPLEDDRRLHHWEVGLT